MTRWKEVKFGFIPRWWAARGSSSGSVLQPEDISSLIWDIGGNSLNRRDKTWRTVWKAATSTGRRAGSSHFSPETGGTREDNLVLLLWPTLPAPLFWNNCMKILSTPDLHPAPSVLFLASKTMDLQNQACKSPGTAGSEAFGAPQQLFLSSRSRSENTPIDTDTSQNQEVWGDPICVFWYVLQSLTFWMGNYSSKRRRKQQPRLDS